MTASRQLGARLAAVRRSIGISQQRAASMVGASRFQMTRWERGRSRVPLSKVLRFSALYDVPVGYLLGVEAPPTARRRVPYVKPIPIRVFADLERMRGRAFQIAQPW